MKDIDLSAIVELAKLKNNKPEEYEMIRSSMKDIIKDITKFELEIIEEIEVDIKEKKKKEKDELDLKIAEKIKRDRQKM